MDFYKYELEEKYKNLFKEISKELWYKWEHIIWQEEIIPFELIKKTVDLDIWFYDARKQRLTPNSKTVQKAFARF
jgi:hypothetical protein